MRRIFITLIIFLSIDLVLSVGSLLSLSALGYLEDDTKYLEIPDAQMLVKRGQKYYIFLCSRGSTPPTNNLPIELFVQEPNSRNRFAGEVTGVAKTTYTADSEKGRISGVCIGRFEPKQDGVAFIRLSPTPSNLFLGVQNSMYGDFVLVFCSSAFMLVLGIVFTFLLSRTRFVRKLCHRGPFHQKIFISEEDNC
jgi:hypothetical protein